MIQYTYSGISHITSVHVQLLSEIYVIVTGLVDYITCIPFAVDSF